MEPSTKYKRAILAVAHAIELLLKERLRRIHPSLIWENVDNFPDLGAKTVSLDKAITRLKRIGGLEFSEKDEKLIRSIKRTRNAIEHYSWSIASQEAEYIIGTSLSLAIFFSETHLRHTIMGYGEVTEGMFSDLLASNPHFAQAHSYRQSEEYKKHVKSKAECAFCKSLVESNQEACPKCGHWNLLIGDGWLEFDPDDDEPF